jgi:hypothetical protein
VVRQERQAFLRKRRAQDVAQEAAAGVFVKGTRAGWDFSTPKNTGGKRSTAWAIPRRPLNPPMAATHVGDKIYVRRAGGDWTVVVDSVRHVEHLSLEAFREGHVVAVWSDPAFGIRYHAVP